MTETGREIAKYDTARRAQSKHYHVHLVYTLELLFQAQVASVVNTTVARGLPVFPAKHSGRTAQNLIIK